MTIYKFKIFETLIRDRSLKQLQKIADLSKSTDIGIRTADIPKGTANMFYVKNFKDFDIETYEKATKQK